MTKNYPGSVFVREYADDIEKEIRIGPACWTADLGFPDLIKPLDPKRQWYLYEEIASLCNITTACPKPSVPKP